MKTRKDNPKSQNRYKYFKKSLVAHDHIEFNARTAII